MPPPASGERAEAPVTLMPTTSRQRDRCHRTAAIDRLAAKDSHQWADAAGAVGGVAFHYRCFQRARPRNITTHNRSHTAIATAVRQAARPDNRHA